MNYWTDKDNQAIRNYYHGSEAARNAIIDRVLYKTLYEMARRTLTSLSMPDDEAHKQDIVVHLVCKVMPRITEDKLQGALAYLWQSARNYTLSYICTKSEKQRLALDSIDPDSVFTSDSVSISQSYMPDDEQTEYKRKEIAQKVLTEIDERIRVRQLLNTTPRFTHTIHQMLDEYLKEGGNQTGFNQWVVDRMANDVRQQQITNQTTTYEATFLMLLKQYIIENDLDIRGFGSYIRKRMCLSLSSYRTLAGRCGLRTKDFNDKL